ncbi:aspartate/tyrosine/aromatic aminotransferase [Paraburkholderia nemoris]|uniref:amino acid aminotransferase n=1 Tax=Paraburkholderia nemoris TaxID=2793076 RepID=UPI0038BB24A5
MFEIIDAFPGDPILSLNEDFQRDVRPGKVNLSIGVYFDNAGNLPILEAVRKAESALLADSGARPYLPMAGMAGYRSAAQSLVFGEQCGTREAGMIATLQTLGGTGALKLGADFLKRYFPNAQVWVSDPSWENHRVIFERAGFTVNTYPYYDDASGGLRFDEMLAALRKIPGRSIVLLHACCHNPTGVDLDRDQWCQVIAALREQDLMPFVDMAYQGFGKGLDQDAFVVRELARQGVRCLVASSFSKNFSLYGERCGALSAVCTSAAQADRVLGQLTATVRASYSNPPTFGASVIARVLTTPALRSLWENELASMCERIAKMRVAIHDGLRGHVSDAMLPRYVSQRGMFTYTGLTNTQVDRLRADHGVYLLRSGRMCVAGLNDRNVESVVKAIAAVSADPV